MEGNWWDQIKDRVDLEVLHLPQDREKNTDEPKTVELTGESYPEKDPNAAFEPITLGTVVEITQNSN